MFVRQNQQQFRNSNADVQIFYGGGQSHQKSWIKPTGVSHIYMLLIGAGGNGDGVTYGGGSGAVTVWYGAAQNVPDELIVIAGTVISGAGFDTTVTARFSNSTVVPTALLTANGGSTSTNTGGTAMTANQFTASGFFQSVAGQDGSSGLITASATTFLSGGGISGGANPERANYGYTTTNSVASPGYFILQPIIVGIGGTDGQKGGLGCGGGLNTGIGGPGMVLIASW